MNFEQQVFSCIVDRNESGRPSSEGSVEVCKTAFTNMSATWRLAHS